MIEEITRLKAENQHLRQVFLLCICALFAVVFFGATRQSKEVVAEKFVLVDDKGNIKAELTSGPEGPRFAFFGKNGEAYVDFIALEDSAGIAFIDNFGAPRTVVLLGVEKTGMYFLDPEGKPRMGMGLPEKGPCVIEFYDPKGKRRASIGFGGEGPGIGLYDAEGKPQVGIGSIKEGSSIVLFSPKGIPQIVVASDGEGPSIDFYDSKGNLIRQLP